MSTNKFIQLFKHPVKSRMFLFSKLPSAYFAGVRVKHLDEEKCQTTVPFKWFSQNPFRSTYFACLSMAAEMSTGALAMIHLADKPPVSMLVLKVNGDYQKKAVGITTFTCEQGDVIKNAIDETIATGEARVVNLRSIGKNDKGETIAEFEISWSFKRRTSASSATSVVNQQTN